MGKVMPSKKDKNTVAPSYFRLGEYRHELELRKIGNEIQEPNLSYVKDYDRYMELQNKKPQTLYRRLDELRYSLNLLGKKDAKKATKEDIEKIVLSINKSGKAQISRAKIKLTLKNFYKWLYKSEEHPDLVRWIKIDVPHGTKLPGEMLTEVEVVSLINACKTSRDKAIIGLLWDTGMRIGELLNLKGKDVVLRSGELSYVTVDGKTGQRRTPIVFSVPFLTNYLNDFGPRANTSSYLFVTKGDMALDYSHVRMLLLRLKERTGIKKRINPHTWRHSRATNYASHLTEQQLKMYFGWTGDSRMAGVYVHMSGSDLDNGIIKANGLDTKGGKIKEPPKPLTIKTCMKCHETNPVTNTYCQRCGTPLDADPVSEMQDIEDMKKKITSQDEVIADLKATLNKVLENQGLKDERAIRRALK